jgi:hypothetical protein
MLELAAFANAPGASSISAGISMGVAASEKVELREVFPGRVELGITIENRLHAALGTTQGSPLFAGGFGPAAVA